MTFLLSRRLPIASAGQLHTNQGMTVGTDITIASISSYLRTHLPEIGVPIGLEKFMGGQSNPTFLLTTQSGKFVLRSKPKGNLLKSAHLVEREFHVMSNLADSGVPVPKMFHLAQDDVSPIGRAFFVMEYLQGRVFWDPTLPDLKVEERCDYYLSMSTSLADLHQIDPQQFGLGDFGKPGNYFVRQLTRWGANYQTSTKTPSRDMLGIMEWLEKTVPPDDGQIALVHGDYRLDNIMFFPQSSSVLGILDWEL